MINEQFFQPAGRAAVHADELFARRDSEDDRLAALGDLAKVWGDHVCSTFCEMTTGKYRASSDGIEVVPQSALADRLVRGAAGFAAYTSGRAAQTLHLSVSTDGIEDSLCEMFGGNQNPSLGDAPADGITPAAALFRDRLARMFERALIDTLTDSGLAYRLVHTGPLPIFNTAGRSQFAILTIALNGESLFPLTLKIALPLEGIDALLAAERKRRVSLSAARGAADVGSGPWGSVELCVKAVLSETRYSLAKLAALQVGTTIFLPINRKVPLVCEGRTIAHGTVGEIDDRIALRISDIVKGTIQ